MLLTGKQNVKIHCSEMDFLDQYEVKKVAEYEFVLFRISNGKVYSYKYPFFELNEANRVMERFVDHPSIISSVWEGSVPLYYRATYRSKTFH